MDVPGALVESAVAGKHGVMRSSTFWTVCLLADIGILGYSHCRKWVSQVDVQLVDSSSRQSPLLDVLLLGLV